MQAFNPEKILKFEGLITQLNEQVDLLESLVGIAGKKIDLMRKAKVPEDQISVFTKQLEAMGSWIFTKKQIAKNLKLSSTIEDLLVFRARWSSEK